MYIVDLIEKKKNNKSLTKDEIKYIINSYVKDEIKDYQMSSLLMAICINGLSSEETFYLTEAMLESGNIIDLSSIKGIKVDKHSTGGVGDKTTLIIAPIVASLGVPIAKMSGRGLGYTGGTIDKLESIPGFNVNININDFIDQVKKINVCIGTTTKEVAPADKKIYALRDVTGTVSSMALIAASIMSKKLATGADKITKVPTTWQEMETFGLATRKVLESTNAFNHVIGSDGVVYDSTVAAADAGVDVAIDLTNVGPNDFRVVSYDSQANFFITMVRQWGGTYTSVETLPNGKTQGYMRYKSSETVEMLKFFNRLFRENIMGIPATFGESSYTSTPFKAFKTIFTIGSSAGVSNCVPADNLFEVEINPIPYNADKPDCKYVISQGTNLVMFKNTDEASRRETWNLLKTLSYDPVTNATFAKASGYIPVTKNAYQTDLYQSYLKDTSLTGTAKTLRDAINVNFDELLSLNNETKGWIQVNGTNINYPIVQTSDNDYYLTHAFDKSWNSAGWVFMDYRNDSETFDKNTILYGHSRLDKTMFGSLKNILKSGWLDDTSNYVIKLSTPYENTMWQVFSVYHLPTTSDYLKVDFSSDSEFSDFLKLIYNRTAHNFGTSVSTNDKILTLSTCYANSEKLVVHAKLIKRETRQDKTHHD